jgi:tRNA pseudouridine38-40 synthase
MPAYRLTVEYDGSDFAGWQVQPAHRTAMGTLRDACRSLGEAPETITAAGRTDAGAHAHGQVVGLTLRRDWDPRRLTAALNALLPQDIAVVGADHAEPSFHARRDAVDRTYRYLVLCREQRAPVTRRHAWTVRGPLDVDSMRAAARSLLGRHDFAAFGRSPAPGGSTVRTVHQVEVLHSLISGSPRFELVTIEVRADAFLRGMMRAFAGALVRVGQGRATTAWVAALVDHAATRDASVPLAPPHGLHQWSVSYQKDAFAA